MQIHTCMHQIALDTSSRTTVMPLASYLVQLQTESEGTVQYSEERWRGAMNKWSAKIKTNQHFIYPLSHVHSINHSSSALLSLTLAASDDRCSHAS